jgi:molybdenum cofactor cytidylyltransferase
MESVITLILAAGASRRMGKIKALLPWGSKTVLEHLLDETAASGPGKTLIITGAYQEEVLGTLGRLSSLTHYNPDWKSGMGSSLACGVREAERRYPEANALLVLLVDQPLLTRDYLKRIHTEHQRFPAHIIASDYGGFAGVPALFPKRFWEDLKDLSRDKGAKGLIASRKTLCRVLDPGPVITDMDTPEAYQKALRKAGIKPKYRKT